MPTTLHFINVGQGNMVLCELDSGVKFLYDCNITDNNANDTLNYLDKVIGKGTPINIFANSHRDADHMRGVDRIHKIFPIKKVWDSGVTGNTPMSTEYMEYMALRRKVGFTEVEPRTYYSSGKSVLRIMNAKNENLANNPNAQSIVIKVQHSDGTGKNLSSALLTGDTDAQAWRKFILKKYSKSDLSTDILLASHHGSISFFDDPT